MQKRNYCAKEKKQQLIKNGNSMQKKTKRCKKKIWQVEKWNLVGCIIEPIKAKPSSLLVVMFEEAKESKESIKLKG